MPRWSNSARLRLAQAEAALAPAPRPAVKVTPEACSSITIGGSLRCTTEDVRRSQHSVFTAPRLRPDPLRGIEVCNAPFVTAFPVKFLRGRYGN
jgi:hypothetical protein